MIFGKLRLHGGKNSEFILSQWFCFKDVLRRNLGTFWSLADVEQVIWRVGKTGSFVHPAVKNSRLGCAKSFRIAGNWKSWWVFYKPADTPSSSRHHRVCTGCSQFRIILMSSFTEKQEKLCCAPADVDWNTDSSYSTDTANFRCVCTGNFMHQVWGNFVECFKKHISEIMPIPLSFSCPSCKA